MKNESTRGLKRKTFGKGDTNRLADYISELKKLPNGKAKNRNKKNVSTETRQNGRAVYGARLKKILSGEFWYTSVRVGSNPTPVFKPFEHDDAEPSADKFCHTGTSIQDDSVQQKQKNRNVVCGW